jgi:hypothetical protein
MARPVQCAVLTGPLAVKGLTLRNRKKSDADRFFGTADYLGSRKG